MAKIEVLVSLTVAVGLSACAPPAKGQPEDALFVSATRPAPLSSGVLERPQSLSVDSKPDSSALPSGHAAGRHGNDPYGKLPSGTRIERFTSRYRSTWSALSRDLGAGVAGTKLDNGRLEVTIAVRPPVATVARIRDLMNSQYQVWEHGAQVYAAHFRPPASARGDENYIETMMEVARVLDVNPVFLRVSVGSCHRDIPYFGVLNYHMLQSFEPAKLDQPRFRNSLRGGGETNQILGFAQRHNDPAVKRQGGIIFVTCSIVPKDNMSVMPTAKFELGSGSLWAPARKQTTNHSGSEL